MRMGRRSGLGIPRVKRRQLLHTITGRIKGVATGIQVLMRPIPPVGRLRRQLHGPLTLLCNVFIEEAQALASAQGTTGETPRPRSGRNQPNDIPRRLESNVVPGDDA